MTFRKSKEKRNKSGVNTPKIDKLLNHTITVPF